MIPEPISITLAVCSTIGFLNLVRQGAEAAHKYGKDYANVAKDAKKICDGVTLAALLVELWRDTWHIHGSTHEQYPVHLWGRQWPAIRIILDNIEQNSRDIDAIV